MSFPLLPNADDNREGFSGDEDFWLRAGPDALPPGTPTPGARPLTALGLAMLLDLPPVLQRSTDYQAIIHPIARELEALEATIEQLRAQFNPATADILLPAWEYMVKLPVGGAGSSIDQRRQKLIARLRKVEGQSEGREWEAQITELVGPGWAYEEHDTGDPTSPAANVIRITLPFLPSSPSYQEAIDQIREITPAHLSLSFSSAAGFVLDESELDRDSFGGM
jgi:hypothetical protein